MIDIESEALRWARVRDDIPLAAGLQGGYDAGRNLIVVAGDLSPVQRRCVLAHEISHARHRDVGCKCSTATEKRADMEAARMLIDPVEYMTAERIYDNEIQIAKELNVMPWVVRAYRMWLHETLTA